MKLFIQEAAQQDILQQVDWYSERELYDIAERFQQASSAAIAALMRMPRAGAPREVSNPRLAGLRSWPVKGFDEFRVYYLVQPELLIVVRVLHGKRDIGALLKVQGVEDLRGASRQGA